MLTQEQISHFETFGLIVLRGLVSSEEMGAISEEFNEVLDEDRQGELFKGDHRQQVIGCVEMRPAMMSIVDDDRIYEPLEQLLGPDFIFWGSDGDLFVGDKVYHPDGSPRNEAEFEYIRIKVGFYLDPLRKDTGCLRVVPGSHKKPLHDALMPQLHRPKGSAPPFGVEGRDLPAFPLETEPEDVIFFDQNTWHGSFGGGTGRRMLALSYFADPTTEDHIGYLRWNYENAFDHIRGSSFTQKDYVHEAAFLDSDRPRIKSMMAKQKDLGFK